MRTSFVRHAGPRSRSLISLRALFLLWAAVPATILGAPAPGATLQGEAFHINGQPAYAGRSWRGCGIDGFSLDARIDFDKLRNNFIAALSAGGSWGFFDFRMTGEGLDDGFQSVPASRGLSSDRQRGFSRLRAEATAPAAGGVSVARVNHRGWPDSLVLSNGRVEAVVVPAIGRVMQFRFAGEEGVFWENPALPGQPAPFVAGHFDPQKYQSAEWLNLGGDKSWPAPEADWAEVTGRKSWCPPPAFDGMPWQAQVEGAEVVMVSPVDPCYGVRVQRRVRLEPGQPVMTVVTRFERVSGSPARIGIWIITQLREPAAVVVPRVRGSALAEGHVLLGPNQRPPSLQVGPEFLTLRRDARAGYKIGSDAGALLWLGKKHACRIDSPRVPGAEYPDNGSSAEVWTNPDPLPYVELEMLGPLRRLGPGETLSQTNRYTLLRRVAVDPAAEAARIFAP